MFGKMNTPVLGVVENMSGFTLEGVVKDTNNRGVAMASLELDGLGEILRVSADKEGRFKALIPIFSSGGGIKESLRLGVPLLGQVPLTPELVVASDAGEPYVLNHADSPTGQVFIQIARDLVQLTEGED